MSQAGKDEFEFKVIFQKEVYFIPVVGVVMLSACAGGILMMIFGFVFHALLGGISAEFLTALVCVFGVFCGVAWIVHNIRIETGRRLVIDRDGITYYKFANEKRLIRWNDIKSVVESEYDYGDGIDYTLKLDLQFGNFKIKSDQFHDYDSIKFIIINRLPQISTTTSSAKHHRVASYDVTKAFEQWGFVGSPSGFIEERRAGD